jgi:hypothetical protein
MRHGVVVGIRTRRPAPDANPRVETAARAGPPSTGGCRTRHARLFRDPSPTASLHRSIAAGRAEAAGWSRLRSPEQGSRPVREEVALNDDRGAALPRTDRLEQALKLGEPTRLMACAAPAPPARAREEIPW